MLLIDLKERLFLGFASVKKLNLEAWAAFAARQHLEPFGLKERLFLGFASVKKLNLEAWAAFAARWCSPAHTNPFGATLLESGEFEV